MKRLQSNGSYLAYLKLCTVKYTIQIRIEDEATVQRNLKCGLFIT